MKDGCLIVTHKLLLRQPEKVILWHSHFATFARSRDWTTTKSNFVTFCFERYELHYLLSGISSDTLFFTLLIICIWNSVPNVMLCTCLHCKSYLLSIFSTQFIRCGVITDMQLEKKFEFSRQKSLCELKVKCRKVRNLILLYGTEWLC